MLTDPVVNIVFLIGIPALVAIFILEGMLIGKVLPTKVIFGLMVVVWASSMDFVIYLVLISAFSASLGQAFLYYLVGSKDYTINDIPYFRFNEDRVERIDQLIVDYGFGIVFVTNCVPFVRGFGTIPASQGDLTAGRFIAISFASSVVYLSIVAVFFLIFQSFLPM